MSKSSSSAIINFDRMQKELGKPPLVSQKKILEYSKKKAHQKKKKTKFKFFFSSFQNGAKNRGKSKQNICIGRTRERNEKPV